MTYLQVELWRIKIHQILESNGIAKFSMPDPIKNPIVEAWRSPSRGTLQAHLENVEVYVNGKLFVINDIGFCYKYEESSDKTKECLIYSVDPAPLPEEYANIHGIFNVCLDILAREFRISTRGILNV